MATFNSRDITPEQLVSFSDAIVIATFGNPPSRKREIPVTAPAGKRAPPYKQTIFRFQVNESLLGQVVVGSTIEVVEADTAMKQSVHYKHYVRDMDMSVAWRHYARLHNPSADESTRIIFLRKSDGIFEFIVDGGYEPILARDEVQRLIIQRHGAIPGVQVPGP